MKYIKLTKEERENRKIARYKARQELKIQQIIEREKTQRGVKKIVISVEWKKSRNWGNCPKAEAEVHYKDGSYARFDHYYASGYGYCKESTVIGQIFNEFLRYKLWKYSHDFLKGGNSRPTKVKNPPPYGVHSYSENNRCYGQGIGVNCFDAISEFIGGKFTHIAGGKTFDVYEYVDIK